MGKGENELGSYPIIADRPCDGSQLEILWKLLHQTPIERSHTYDSFAARKRWGRENIWVPRHGRERRIDRGQRVLPFRDLQGSSSTIAERA